MKKNLIKILFIVTLIFIALLVYIAFLKNDEKPMSVEKEMITITFDSDGGSKVSSIKIEKNTRKILPSSIRDGYDFLGWYLLDELIDEGYVYKEDTLLKAHWKKIEEEKKTYTVTFDSQGGSSVGKISVDCNKTLKLPKNPTKEGYEFVTWMDKYGKSILNGAKLSCEDVTLYADWKKIEEEKKTYTVTFDSQGGSSVSPIVVECDKHLFLPEKPTKEGYEFVTWMDKHGRSIVDDANLSCEDITLYADWKKIEE